MLALLSEVYSILNRDRPQGFSDRDTNELNRSSYTKNPPIQILGDDMLDNEPPEQSTGLGLQYLTTCSKILATMYTFSLFLWTYQVNQ
jgi:hypothetical protein